MAITGPSSYPPTMAQFVTHWDNVLVDPAIAGNFPLPDGTTRDDFNGLRDQLVLFAASIQDRINDLELTRGTIESSKAVLLGRLAEFNRKVRGFLSKTHFAKALPDVPTANAGEAKILAPLDDMASLWPRINAATIPNFMPPLVLDGGYDATTFAADLAALKTAYQNYQSWVQQLKLDRERRNTVQDTAYAAMRDYRAAVQGTFPPEHALVVSLPRLTPDSSGTTPDAVSAAGEFDADTSEAVLTWTASTDANLDYYEIRMTPGSTYDTDSDTAIGTVAPGTLEFRTTVGVASPSDTTSYKVYVVTTSGHEAGSNAVTIFRP